MEQAATHAQAGAQSSLPGPYPVGAYAARLKRKLQEFARVQLVGEVWGFRAARARVYFELRDARGALPCSMWRNEFELLAHLVLADEVGERLRAQRGFDGPFLRVRAAVHQPLVRHLSASPF